MSKTIKLALLLSGIFLLGCSFSVTNSSVEERVLFNPTITLTPFQPVKNTEIPTEIPPMVYLTGAGDISICGLETDDQTADLLADQPGYIFTLGDNQNDEAEPDRFSRCFDASWGKYKDRMIPTIGNHEYFTTDAAGYFDYFGDLAGERGKGYYSMDVGAWHVVVINSRCDVEGWCDYGSEMMQWLEEDLENDAHLCTIALWHIPRFSSGSHGDNESIDPIWQTVVSHNVDLVLNGHEHQYERFKPMNQQGEIDLANGTRLFIVGTGGVDLRPQNVEKNESEVFDASVHGVLQLALEYGTYTWKFLPVTQDGFSDSGRGYCH
jgi:hypothetical protein